MGRLALPSSMPPSVARRTLFFPQSCIASLWFSTTRLLLMRDYTMGSHFRMATLSFSSMTTGVVLGSSAVCCSGLGGGERCSARGWDATRSGRCGAGLHRGALLWPGWWCEACEMGRPAAATEAAGSTALTPQAQAQGHRADAYRAHIVDTLLWDGCACGGAQASLGKLLGVGIKPLEVALVCLFSLVALVPLAFARASANDSVYLWGLLAALQVRLPSVCRLWGLLCSPELHIWYSHVWQIGVRVTRLVTRTCSWGPPSRLAASASLPARCGPT